MWSLKNSSTCCMLFLLINLSLTNYISASIVENGDFEHWVNGSVFPEGWGGSSFNTDTAVVKLVNDVFSGQNALKVVFTTTTTHCRFNSPYFKLSGGKYKLTYFVKGTSVLRWIVLTPKGASPRAPVDGGVNLPASDYLQSGIKLKNSTWVKRECYFDVPEEVVDEEYSLNISINGTETSHHFSLDKVSLKKVAPDDGSPWQSELVKLNQDGSLSYFPDDFGYFIPDFSAAGYKGGGVEIPDVPVVKVINAVQGDNTAGIQAAIDEVGAMPLVNGIRGAVLLKAGLYNIAGSIYLQHHGVILRGEGQGDSPVNSTILMATGNIPHQRTFIQVGYKGTANQWNNKLSSNVNIVDDYVPSGSDKITLSSVQLFSIGDQIVIQHDDTQNWLNAIEGGVGDSGAPPWTLNDNVYIVYNRYIRNIDRNTNTITLDAPVYYGLRKSLSQSYVYKISNTNIIKNVGVENLRIDCEFDVNKDTVESVRGRYLCDENHAWNGLAFSSVEDGWAKNITAIHFGGFGIYTTRTSRTSIISCNVIDPVSVITGSRRYAFCTSFFSQMILFEDCYARNARHGFVSGGTASASGVVFLNCRSDLAYAASEGHRRWSSGFLYDNFREVAYNGTYEHTLALNNRGNYGTSHGWGLVNSVAWNCDLTAGDPSKGHLIVQRPPTAQNFAIGCKAKAVDGLGPFNAPDGFIEGTNLKGDIEPSSLYEAQLNARMNQLTNVQVIQSIEDNKKKDSYRIVNNGTPVQFNFDFVMPEATLIIYSATGQIVKQCKHQDNQFSIDLSMYPKGLYYAKFVI